MNPCLILLTLSAAGLALAVPHQSKLGEESLASWNAFKTKHGKSYESEAVETMRRAIFEERKKEIDLFNEQLSQTAGYTLGLNHMSDWTDAERARLNGFKLDEKDTQKCLLTAEGEQHLQRIRSSQSHIPDTVDWRKVPNRVTRVKDQGKCGSCWTFSTTGVLEGQEAVQNPPARKILELSEQNLIDCVTTDHGCNGGLPLDALNFIMGMGGVDSEASYPYEGVDGKCRFNISTAVMSDSGAIPLPQGDEETLKELVATFGPVSVAIDAGNRQFSAYKSGVFNFPECKTKAVELDHAVLVVGYGTDPERGDYWLVKNSWGPDWGEDGYIRMSRNRNNQCGITTCAVIPKFSEH